MRIAGLAAFVGIAALSLLVPSAPGTKLLSRLNGWPARSPADASPSPSRVPTHGSGPRWFRYAFLVEDLHPLLLAGLPAHSD